MPALNENDESNFDYGNHVGFTTAFYHEQREIMDDASWRALFMNQPIEREGGNCIMRMNWGDISICLLGSRTQFYLFATPKIKEKTMLLCLWLSNMGRILY